MVVMVTGIRIHFEGIAGYQLRHYGYALERVALPYARQACIDFIRTKYKLTKIVPLRIFRGRSYFTKYLFHETRRALRSWFGNAERDTWQ